MMDWICNIICCPHRIQESKEDEIALGKVNRDQKEWFLLVHATRFRREFFGPEVKPSLPVVTPIRYTSSGTDPVSRSVRVCEQTSDDGSVESGHCRPEQPTLVSTRICRSTIITLLLVIVIIAAAAAAVR